MYCSRCLILIFVCFFRVNLAVWGRCCILWFSFPRSILGKVSLCLCRESHQCKHERTEVKLLQDSGTSFYVWDLSQKIKMLCTRQFSLKICLKLCQKRFVADFLICFNWRIPIIGISDLTFHMIIPQTDFTLFCLIW